MYSTYLVIGPEGLDISLQLTVQGTEERKERRRARGPCERR